MTCQGPTALKQAHSLLQHYKNSPRCGLSDTVPSPYSPSPSLPPFLCAQWAPNPQGRPHIYTHPYPHSFSFSEVNWPCPSSQRFFSFFLICVWMRTMFLPGNRSTFCQKLLGMVSKNWRRQAVKSGPASRQYSWQIPVPKHTVCELGEPVTSPLQTSVTFISKLG